MSTAVSFCRFCHAFCGITVTVEDGRAVKVIGDVENPLYRGYTCVKGRALPEQHAHPDRLLRSQRREPDGRFVPIAAETAMDEIAARIGALVAEHGPRSIATYTGTYGMHYPSGKDMGKAFLRALGSPMRFSSGSIDQPGKGVARELHGRWAAGPQPFETADRWMIIGANPVVSMWGGIPQYDPARRLREAKANGLRLIVIDPRRTETAANADLFLQPRPGEDPTILAGLIRAVIADGLLDRAFVADETEHIDALIAAVEPFTPTYVERRAGVPAQLLVEAAHLYASGASGSVTAGTGPNMAPRGTLTEYLVAVLQTLCGRWLRAGSVLPNPFVLLPQRSALAAAEPRQAAWGYGEQLRVKGLGDNAGGLPTAALPDEILLDGPGRVRALIVIGGNPLAAWPDQRKTAAALAALDLLVTIDIKMSETAKLAHFVVAPRLSLEVDGMTIENEKVWGYGAATTGFPVPYAQYAPAVVAPPAGSDLVEEWEVFYGLAQRLGLELELDGVPIDMASPPTTLELHRIIAQNGRVPLEEVMRHPHGRIFDDEPVIVQPKPPDWPHRLDIGNEHMVAELVEVAAEPLQTGEADLYPYRMVSRRLRDVYNSSGRDIAHLVRRHPTNPAYVHPDTLTEVGVEPGDLLEIRSRHDAIIAVAAEAADVAPGVVSIAHAWGGHPDDDPTEAALTAGANTGRLCSMDDGFDPITGLPVMSAIPVTLRPH